MAGGGYKKGQAGKTSQSKRAKKTKIAPVRFPNTKKKEHFPNLPKRKPNVKKLPA